MPCEAPMLEPELRQRKRLFVIGPTRCGTTILQNALNSCSDIYLLGEANLFHNWDIMEPRAKYNAMHRRFGNQETKSTFLPMLSAEETTYTVYLGLLSEYYKYVGEKIALGGNLREADFGRLFDFQCLHFFSASYFFTFRRPSQSIISSEKLAPYNICAYSCVYLETVLLYLRMRRILPMVYCFFHENMNSDTFAHISELLGVDVSRAHQLYSNSDVTTHDPSEFLAPDWLERMRKLDEVYEELKANQDRTLDQLEQHTNPKARRRITPLGRCKIRQVRY